MGVLWVYVCSVSVCAWLLTVAARMLGSCARGRLERPPRYVCVCLVAYCLSLRIGDRLCQVDVIGGSGFTFPYVPSHLHHILFELIKNSMRAVVETHGV